TGTIFFPNDPATPNFGNLSFAGTIDDSFALWIDNVTYISRVGWTTPAQSGNIHLTAGPHSFEARFGSTGGHGGANQPLGLYGYTGFSSSIGFVYRVNKGSTDPLATSTNATDYFQTTPAYIQPNGKPAPLGGYPQDPGDGSLFQTTARTGMIKNG